MAGVTEPGSEGRRWTSQQWAAINAGGNNILVSAAAGSGKTAVLTRRVIRRLVEPPTADIDRLLVVTFTEAAAAEMRKRIADALENALRNGAGPDLEKQLSLLNQASISTIHSFCLRVIRSHFHRLQLDPGFRVMDENEAALMRLEVIDDLFNRLHGDPAFRGPFVDLVSRYGGEKGDQALQDIVLRLYNYSRSQPWPGRWLDDAATAFDLPPGTGLEDTAWWGALIQAVSLELQVAGSSLHQALALAGSPGGPATYADRLGAELDQVRSALEACERLGSWEELAACCRSIVFERLPPVGKDQADEALKDAVGKLRDSAKKRLKSLLARFFARPAGELVADLRAVAPQMANLIDLVKRFDQSYRDARTRAAALDFSDLERYCLDLLLDPASEPERPVPSDIARELQEKYEEVLVDEYQDTNPAQDLILALVSRRNLFMVGDVKQSIYRFRLAEPGLFRDKQARYLPVGTSETGRGPKAPGVKISLSTNFRSRWAIVDAVNALFGRIMTGGIGGVDYDDEARLVCGREGEEGECVELHLVERRNGEPGPVDGEVTDDDDDRSGRPCPDELEALEKEACVIADRIRRMAGEGVAYRDIAVLLRSTSGRANMVLDVFARAGIPAYAEVGTGYFEAIEVETILSLLAVIDNPRQDIPLAAVLRSPIGGFEAEALARIRLRRRDGDFYDALRAVASDPHASSPERRELACRAAAFLHRLDGWRTAARRGPLGDLVWRIYRETGYFDYAGGMPGGAQRQANLRALHDRARQFDQFARRGLFRFLRFIERLRDSQGDLGTARALGENENVVRVMSIHRSKGLEFPVVFVADLGKKFNQDDLRGDLLYDRDLGLGPYLVDVTRRIKYPTLAHHAVRERARLQGLAEEMRVLYVALTRARDRLVLVGSARNMDRMWHRWSSLAIQGPVRLPVAHLAGARSYLDWIGAALAGSGGNSTWKVQFWGTGQASRQVSPVALAARRTAAPNPDWGSILSASPEEPAAIPAEIDRRLTWEYGFRPLAGKAAKVSATEINRLRLPEAEDEDEMILPLRRLPRPVRRPRFLAGETRATAAEAGTATHLALQHLDLAGSLDEPGIRAQLDGLVDRQVLGAEQAGMIDVPSLARLFASPLGRFLIDNRDRVRREVPFSLGIPAPEIYPDLPPALAGNDRVLVQGIIDCLVDGPDGFILIDFKTDRVTEANTAGHAAIYRNQLAIYARAVQAVFRRPVVRAYLFFLDAGIAEAVDMGRLPEHLTGL